MFSHAPVPDEHVEYDYEHIKARLLGALRADHIWRETAAARNGARFLGDARRTDPQLLALCGRPSA